ncbi:MAG: hypothetical protein JSV33_01935 [bacterium]|nr:MAG: hypothetical protein JSV33_01935 [bacterium]
MVSFTFPGIKIFLVVGIAEIVVGALIIAGILRSKSGMIARVLGGIVLIAFGIFFITMRSFGAIAFEEGAMHLKVPFQRDRVIRSSDIEEVWAVNITIDTEYRPERKISGGNVGDIRTGWYRLANGEKAFLTLNGVRALYIKTSLGFPALVGTEDFEAFEEAFRDHVYRDQ